MIKFNELSYSQLEKLVFDKIQSTNINTEIRSALYQYFMNYSDYIHSIAQKIYLTENRNKWRKFGILIHQVYKENSFIVLQSIYYILSWFSDFKYNTELSCSWNKIGEWRY